MTKMYFTYFIMYFVAYSVYLPPISDVKRSQNLDAEAKAKATRPRPRPKIIMKKVSNND